MNMIHHRIHSSALGLAAVVLAFVALPFTGCQSGSNKSSTAEAVAMINDDLTMMCLNIKNA